MKTILMSIRPEWVHKIFTGQKTIELRKTAPKPPFRVVVYCTQGDSLLYRSGATKMLYSTSKRKEKALKANGHTIFNGKVVGEFTCEKTDKISVHNDIVYSVGNVFADKLKNMCLTVDELKDYLGTKNSGYAIGIASPKLYDKPKELSEFSKPCPHDGDCDMCVYNSLAPFQNFWEERYICRKPPISRPPQSWCYVEEIRK